MFFLSGVQYSALYFGPARLTSRPGRNQGLLYKHHCDSFINKLSHSLILFQNAFTVHQALMVEDGAFSHKIDYITFFRRI